MCGIFGIFVKKGYAIETALIEQTLNELAQLTESRGKDSSGLVIRSEVGEFHVLKGTMPLASLLKQGGVARCLHSAVDATRSSGTLSGKELFAVMGHSRLATNGSHFNETNNQPIIKNGVIGIHNGIICNEKELWASIPNVKRELEIDTEVMLALFRENLREGWDVPSAVSKTIKAIFGTVAAAFLLDDHDMLALATNNGSLYVLTSDTGYFAFASEEYFLREMAARTHLKDHFSFEIHQVRSGRGLILEFSSFSLKEFSFENQLQKLSPDSKLKQSFKIDTQSFSDGRPQRELILDPAGIAAHPRARSEAGLLEDNTEKIKLLRRCTRCLLPTTFPFISFNEQGVCNYCENYKIKNKPKPIEELFNLVKPYRRTDGGYDCIIPYSGGRDSTHTLHIAKNVLKLNPVAFTYDWGMVTDLARRNIARVCGKLGVENIIVSADIWWKRENIRKNILAWLKDPQLGMVPLFMAGDKYFFYYCSQIKKQTGIRLNIWGINPLENTDFKVGFLGVPPDHDKERIYSLSAKRQMKLFASIGKIILRNPAYINGSIIDTVGSFFSRSIAQHRDYYHMYDYYRWDEKEVEDLVLNEYKWETAIDTKTTWRIGDGTAPFYNYIYYTVAGFSEYDTFRSNQIREGALTREEGLRLVSEENRPRYPSIKWYTDILGLDFETVIKRINAMPKLYPR